jgi:hypothetical protein
MKKSHIFFGLATLALALYAIEKHDVNVDCYEIIPPQGKFGTMLLDKCKGQTFLPVKEDFDKDDDGKIDGYTYRWTTMRVNKNSEIFWEEKQ